MVGEGCQPIVVAVCDGDQPGGGSGLLLSRGGGHGMVGGARLYASERILVFSLVAFQHKHPIVCISVLWCCQAFWLGLTNTHHLSIKTHISLFISAPKAYQHDCACLIGLAPDHGFHQSEAAQQKAAAKTKALWEREYPDEPYKVNYKKIPEDFTYRCVA